MTIQQSVTDINQS